MYTTVTSPIDQGLGALSIALVVVLGLVLLAGTVVVARSRDARRVILRVRTRLTTAPLGRLLRLTAPGEAARFAAGLTAAVQGEVRSTIVLSLEHDIQPSGWLAVAIPPDVQAWAAANVGLARGVTLAAVTEVAVDAVVAVNARRFSTAGAQHQNQIREQARKRESVMEVAGVVLLAVENDTFTVSVGHTKAAAMVNAQRLSGSAAPLAELSEPGAEVGDRRSSSRSHSYIDPVPVPTRSAVTAPVPTRSAFESAHGRQPSAIAVATILGETGARSHEVVVSESLSIGRRREAGLEVTGDLSVSANHLLARLLPGGACIEVHALGRTGTWATDVGGVTKYLKKGETATLRLPAKIVLGDAHTTVVNFEEM